MNDLIQEASKLLAQKYNPPIHSVAAALETTSGKVVTAVNIDHFLGYTCAETAALTIAINQGDYKIKRIVAVRKDNSDDSIQIVSMCGKCRQIFYDYTPDVRVGTDQGSLNIADLLPSPFTRQQHKIQNKIASVQ